MEEKTNIEDIVGTYKSILDKKEKNQEYFKNNQKIQKRYEILYEDLYKAIPYEIKPVLYQIFDPISEKENTVRWYYTKNAAMGNSPYEMIKEWGIKKGKKLMEDFILGYKLGISS